MIKKFFREFKKIFDFGADLDKNKRIIQNIENSVEFRGAKMWDLVFAIVVASIGLNINSIPVIIGAMLISPLMGPIVGLGLSLGTNDYAFFKKSIANLFVATAIGVIVSAIYFYLSPISNAQSELLSRTTPNVYDIMIAFFGGLAGIAGLARLEKGNVVAGVAIATALMPPLCTVGYGLSTGQVGFFWGALYLYALNCIFICLATLAGVKYLKLPPIYHIDHVPSLLTRRIFPLIVAAIAIPAIYSAYVFVMENDFEQNASSYVENTFIRKGYAIIYQKFDFRSKPRRIELAFLSDRFSASEIKYFKKILADYNLSGVDLVVRQDEEALTKEQWNQVIANIKDESEKIKAIEAKIAGDARNDDSAPERIAQEARAINGKILKIALGKLPLSENLPEGESEQEEVAREIYVQTVLVYAVDGSDSFTEPEKETIESWMRSRMQDENIMVYFIDGAWQTGLEQDANPETAPAENELRENSNEDQNLL